MSNHSHNHHHHDVENTSTKNIIWAFCLNTCFAIVELIGGYITNSVSITSDAIHDFGDSLSLGLSLYFHKKSNQKSDSKYTYGYKRFSLIGAFVNSIVLVIGSVFVITESFERIANPVQPDAKGMIWLAILGITVNAIGMLKLTKGKSINERVISLHFIEDILGWIAVFIGAIMMHFYDVPILDPILSLCIACYILYNVYGNIKSTIKVVLQGFPTNINRDKLLDEFLSNKEVHNVHDLHVWSLDGNYNVLSAHVVIKQDVLVSEAEQLKQKIKHDMLHLGINHSTIEFEMTDNNCEDCSVG
jgi:cobalt-zinc-cadmium efflux system protein